MICINFGFFEKTKREKRSDKARESHTVNEKCKCVTLGLGFSSRLVLQIKQIGCSWIAEHGVTNAVCFVVMQIHFRLELQDSPLMSPVGLDIDSRM